MESKNQTVPWTLTIISMLSQTFVFAIVMHTMHCYVFKAKKKLIIFTNWILNAIGLLTDAFDYPLGLQTLLSKWPTRQLLQSMVHSFYNLPTFL